MAHRNRVRDALTPDFDSTVVGIAVVSIVLSVGAGLVQVRYGAFEMSFETAVRALLDQAVWTRPRVLATIVLGESAARAIGLYADLGSLTNATIVVWTIRLPRVLVAALVGINLAISGAIFQAITRNELASPYVLGVSSGAGVAVVFTLVFSLGTYLLPFAAVVGGAAAFAIVYLVAWRGGTTPVRLILAGVVVGTIFNSLQTGMFYFIESNGVMRTAVAWLAGSLVGVGWQSFRVVAVPTLVITPLALLAARHLDVLLLGERTARSLGMSYRQSMRYVILPQAIRRVIPPLGNEFIALLKDSSLVSVIAVQDLLRSGRLIISRTYESFIILFTVAVIYFIMTFVLTRVVNYTERKLSL